MRRGLLTGAMAMVLAVSMAAPVAGAATTATDALPPAFRVSATNGYTAEALGLYNPERPKGLLLLTLRRGDTGATYTTQATFTEDSIEADFGALGEIDVHSVATGGTATERSSCGGKPVTVPTGWWEGTISFRGEEGFAVVDATHGVERLELNVRKNKPAGPTRIRNPAGQGDRRAVQPILRLARTHS